MRKIVIMSHGELAKAALSTLGFFMSGLQNVTAISAYADDCDPKAELEKFWAQTSPQDQVILCTDILGGSVNQLTLPYLSRPNTYIFTGFNFPMLLQLACLDEDASPQQIKALAEVGKEAVICMNDYQFEEFGEEDE